MVATGGAQRTAKYRVLAMLGPTPDPKARSRMVPNRKLRTTKTRLSRKANEDELCETLTNLKELVFLDWHVASTDTSGFTCEFTKVVKT